MTFAFVEIPVGTCSLCNEEAFALLSVEEAEKYHEHDIHEEGIMEILDGSSPDLQLLLTVGIHPLCWADLVADAASF